MVWVVGIDEAGYGPNLGPLVLSSVAVQVPDPDVCLWERLATVICRAQGRIPSDRLVIDDSKKVYAAGKGWDRLERTVITVLGHGGRFADVLSLLSVGESAADLASEPWFVADELLPCEFDPTELVPILERFLNTSERANVTWGTVKSVALVPSRFNAQLTATSNKADVLADGLARLLTVNRELPGSEPIHFRIDKQGGRHFYSGLLQKVFPTAWVQPVSEGAQLSHYRLWNLEREIEVRFQPGGDAAHATVALASMTSKFLREVSMRQFNRFWTAQVPGLRPTAGYPVDASRFFAEIRQTMTELGLTETQLWRRK